MAVVWAIRKFATYMSGCKFTLMTDPNRVMADWLLELLGQIFEIIHVSGRANVTADELSRMNDVSTFTANIRAHIIRDKKNLNLPGKGRKWSTKLTSSVTLGNGLSLKKSGILTIGGRTYVTTSRQQHPAVFRASGLMCRRGASIP